MEFAVGTSRGIQDDDVALAKLLQEQERALFMLGNSGSAIQAENEELTDEEFARRLQEEEDQATYQAMAYGEFADGGGLLVDSDADAAGTGSEEQEQSAMHLTYEDMLALGDLAGKVSKGLKADSISRLPVERVCSLRSGGSVVALERCCICQVEFEDDDEATPLPCRHCYHSDCVRQWLQQSKACPVCGKELDGV